MRLLECLGKRSPLCVAAAGVTLALLIGVIDYVTGEELSVSIFYLLPVAMLAWMLGRRAGALMSVFCAVVWFGADAAANHEYSHFAIPYWNALVGLGFSLAMTYALAALQQTRHIHDELTGFIVHDLKSPLTNVLTGLMTLQAIQGDKPNPDEAELVEMGIVSSNRILALVNSLLDVSRLEGGKMPVHSEEVSAKELAEHALGSLGMWATQNSVSLDYHACSDNAAVLADRELTTRVLINLTSNALKFSPAGSAITVGVSDCGSEMLTFSVADHGPGIPAKWVSKVFDKFMQVQARKAGAAVGTGLGLTFCKLAIEAQGGRIWLESEEGKGTTVRFTLPAAAPITPESVASVSR